MRRRTFLAGMCVSLTVPLAARAQSPGKVYRIGLLSPTSADERPVAAFRQGLRELGWIEGQNIVIEHRNAGAHVHRLPQLAAELVRLNVDIIAAGPTPHALAARNATVSVPIVMLGAADPVELGLVASLARPGGNVTGVSWSVDLDIIGKGLELLKATMPRLRLVGVLWNPANPAHSRAMTLINAAAGSLGLQLQFAEARTPNDFDGAFATISRQRVEAILVVAEALFVVHSAQLTDLERKYRLPSMHGLRQNVEAGGLMSYGPNTAATWRRAASFVDKILKGAKPADLPVEQPSTFELVINLKTAKALGLTIPPSLLLRADQVIE